MIELNENHYSHHKEVDTCLRSIIKNKSFANGYIFYGPEGVGKKQTALQFIKEIFKHTSTNRDVEERINNNNHPDFLIIEPVSLSETKRSKNADLEETTKSRSEIIKISQIRNIKTFLGHKSITAGKKIVLLSDAHLLNEAASNCLLKTLEEPSNGIFILLTSKINLLLETVISRCQLVRFRSFSSEKISLTFKDYLNPKKFNINNKLQIHDLINTANGSPIQLIKNIEIWDELSEEITNKLDFPIKDSLEILALSKLISEKLEIYKQISLVNILQIIWWRETNNVGIIKKLENLKVKLKKNIQPRLAWEVTLLKISME